MIHIECNADYAFVQELGFSRKKIDHSGTKSLVGRNLENAGAGCGLADEDPGAGQPPLFREARRTEDFGDYHLLEKGNCRLVILAPRLEEWVLKRCSEEKIDPKDFNLPSAPKRLKVAINLRQNDFRRLIAALIEKSGKVKSLKQLLHKYS